MKYLLLKENIENIRNEIEAKVERPTYISSCLNIDSNSLYRFPNSNEFRKSNKMELFLSKFNCDTRCVEKAKYILKPSQYLRMIFPLVKDDDEKIYDIFNKFGLKKDFPPMYTVFFNNDEIDFIPDELKKFIFERRGYRQKYGPSISFARSGLIEAPYKEIKEWHLGFDFSDKTDKRSTIQPPGQYSGNPISILQEINRMCFVECDPKHCICCHGNTGERKHLAFSQVAQVGTYPAGHICLKCLPNATNAWIELLQNWLVD
jgi:hypothetical protein